MKSSEEAAYMWSDSEDLSIIADLYQIKIKVITTKGKNDKNPTVNWIYPDQEMKKYSEFNRVEMNDMILFHQNDCHFNLDISKNTDLAKLGSLSYRYNVGPMATRKKEENKEVNDNKMEVESNSNSKEGDIIDELKKKLKQAEVSREEIQKKYYEIEKKYT